MDKQFNSLPNGDLLCTQHSQSEMGLTAKLPDDVLIQVFSNIDSIPNKFSLAAVNKRYRRCMFKQMKQPMPLELNFNGEYLYGHRVPLHKWSTALEALAKVARFSMITDFDWGTQIPSIASTKLLHIFNSAPDCLAQVTAIRIYPDDEEACNAEGLEEMIRKCSKLSLLHLPTIQIQSSRVDPHGSPALDLVSALNGKSLTELGIHLENCTLQDVTDLLHCLKPNSLRHLHLFFKHCPWLDVVPIMRELRNTSAQSIEHVRIGNSSDIINLSLSQLFAFIPDFPSLREWFIVGQSPLEELIPAVKLLLSNHGRETQLAVEYKGYEDLLYLPSCQILAIIRQLQAELPGLTLCFDDDDDMLKLNLGNTSIALHRLDVWTGQKRMHNWNTTGSTHAEWTLWCRS